MYCARLVFGLLLLLNAVHADNGEFPCRRRSMYEVQLFNGSCYGYGEYWIANYDGAEKFCQDENYRVTSIHSAEENEFLRQLLHSGSDRSAAVIGLRSMNNVLFWMDGTPVDYTNFGKGYTGMSGACILLEKDGSWSSIDCIDLGVEKHPFICKAPPVEQEPECPTTSIFYDLGILHSPMYPLGFNKTMDCKYQLAAKNNHRIIASFLLYKGHYAIKAYDGTREDPSRLLFDNSNSTMSTYIIQSTSNRVLISFHADSDGQWSVTWYSTKNVPSSVSEQQTEAGLSAPIHKYSNPLRQCPENNVFSLGGRIVSPNAPFGCDPDLECMYYFKYPNDTGAWQIWISEMVIGKDDYLELVDLRSNTTFASCLYQAKAQKTVNVWRKLTLGKDAYAGTRNWVRNVRFVKVECASQ